MVCRPLLVLNYYQYELIEKNELFVSGVIFVGTNKQISNLEHFGNYRPRVSLPVNCHTAKAIDGLIPQMADSFCYQLGICLMSKLWCIFREQPIFSVKCHVFQIDPETKKNWLPASKTAVAVSYYYDSARNTYRIISVEGSKVIILAIWSLKPKV